MKHWAFLAPASLFLLFAHFLPSQTPGVLQAQQAPSGAVGQAQLPGVTPNGANGISVAGEVRAKNMASIGPRYDVTEFGAAGNGRTDDTAAIQAAFNACWNHGATPYGGVVEFPGGHTYVISSTINIYDTCRIEGVIGSELSTATPPYIEWNGPATGTVYSPASFTVAANTSLYPPSSPSPAVLQRYSITFPVTNAASAGNWVVINNCTSTAGLTINRTVAQVAQASGSSITVVVPSYPEAVTNQSDTCTVTTTSVALATDSSATFENEISNIAVNNASGLPADQDMGVGIYLASKQLPDAGTRIWNAWFQAATLADYYFAQGGINIQFDGGWRSDAAASLGNVYFRAAPGFNNFGMENGTITAANTASSGPYITLDAAQNCAIGFQQVHATFRNMNLEVDEPFNSGNGVFQMYECPGNTSNPKFYLDLEGTFNTAYYDSPSSNTPTFVMSPADDHALELSISNSVLPYGTNGPFLGLPRLQRDFMAGQQGIISNLSYNPLQEGETNGSTNSNTTVTNLIGDVNISTLWEHKTQASAFLYSDTAYDSLPNATTLYAGQIIAPPSYWLGTNGLRYAVDVVYQTGTTGKPNGGGTTCSGASGTNYITCTSATDLSPGQRFQLGSYGSTIAHIDATNPDSVRVYYTGTNISEASGTPLAFTAPVLGPEIQLPTKSSRAPSSLPWAQGDMERNSGATANGVAAWVNVAAGTPGRWAAIPLGDSSGLLAPSQVSSGAKSPAPACFNGSGGALTNSGCSNTISGTARGSATTVSHTFSAAFSVTPNCWAAPESNVGPWYVSSVSASEITITYTTSGSSAWMIGCQGRGGAW